VCSDTCEYDDDRVCDDGGTDSTFDACDFGTDCTDCGARDPCREDCLYSDDGVCDDGGPGADYDVCDEGTDCIDCGPRG
jgi:hypothetical protein